MVKVSELTGAKLDYWVYRAENGKALADFTGGTVPYSTDWKWGGPIIEREGIAVDCGDGSFKGNRKWEAHIGPAPLKRDEEITGHTALEAAMRCFVASKFGEDVPDGD